MPAVRLGTPLRLLWRVHRAFVRLTGGRFARAGVLPALLLTTRGRRSGERRYVVLNYMREDGSFVVIASYAGEDRDPAWWLNLKTTPEADVAVDGTRMRVRASELDGVRRAAVWQRLIQRDPAYAEFQQRAARRIPLVLLEPLGR